MSTLLTENIIAAYASHMFGRKCRAHIGACADWLELTDRDTDTPITVGIEPMDLTLSLENFTAKVLTGALDRLREAMAR